VRTKELGRPVEGALRARGGRLGGGRPSAVVRSGAEQGVGRAASVARRERRRSRGWARGGREAGERQVGCRCGWAGAGAAGARERRAWLGAGKEEQAGHAKERAGLAAW
jgi:hypothetical protein